MAIDEAIHLPPTEPRKILCVHLNYASRVEEFGAGLPAAPTYFQKPVSALCGHGADVVRPAGCEWLNYEGEVAAVIGRHCRHVRPEDVGPYIAGYTVANDYGLHDFRDTDAGSMLRVKGSDTLCPVGPALVADWDFRNKTVRTSVNGVLVQDGNTDEMQWDMHYLVADLARNITLEPGDIVLTGTPANSRPVKPGDVVAVSVEGLGTLQNQIVSGPAAIADDFGDPAHQFGRGALHRTRRRLGNSAAFADREEPADRHLGGLPGALKAAGRIDIRSSAATIRGHLLIWVFSSAGRATALQAVGRRFDPCNTHQNRLGGAPMVPTRSGSSVG